jgi:AP2-associated kinase
MLSGLSGYIKGVKKAIGNMGTAHQTTPTLGRIRIGSRDIEEIKLISQGGYAYVFEVRDVQTGEIFALKKMICQSPERVQTAKNEINYLRALPDHPNLLKVFDTHVDNKDGCYYVYVLLEFCADGSIFDLMAKYESSRLSEKQIIFIMREVCDGVKALHSMRPAIAHRDLKIENVLLNNKRFKLCDFGSCSTSVVDFAKVQQSQYHTYEEEYDKNTTLMYRPPEMCDPYQKLIVSEKVDVWMLGCILYTMCFYKHPFQECSKLSIVNAAYTFPKDHNYAPKLIDIIRICLTPNPTTRPSVFDISNLFDNYFELNNVKLNPDAQKIKEEHRKQEQEMAKFENNSSNLRKFNGDIPVHELMKLQQQLANDEDSSPVHVKAQTQAKMSHKQASHGKLNSHKNSSDFDGFADFSQKNQQTPDLHQFHSSPGLGNNNKDWLNFDDKPNPNHQSNHQSSFAPNKPTTNNQVNAQWQNFDFGGSSNSNQQQPNNNNNNNNNQWNSWNQNQQQQQVKPNQMQQQQQQQPKPQPQPQNQMGMGMGGFNNNNNFNNNMMNNAQMQQMQMQKQMQMQQQNQGWNNQGGWNNQNKMQMNNNMNGWNQNMQMQNNNMNNMNRMQQNFNSNNGGMNQMNNFNTNPNMGGGFQNNNMQSNNQNTTTVTNNLLDLADTKPVRLDTASGIMSLYAKK